MKSLLFSLNHPLEAFQKGDKILAYCLVLLTIFINTIFDPFIRFTILGTRTNFIWVMKTFTYGLLTYATFCIFLFLVCHMFGSKLTLKDHIKTWGLTYVPNCICALILTFTELFYYELWDQELIGMLFSIAFVGLLIWKTILYLIYLREFAGLRSWRLLVSILILCTLIMILAALDGYAGLKTPVL